MDRRATPLGARACVVAALSVVASCGDAGSSAAHDAGPPPIPEARSPARAKPRNAVGRFALDLPEVVLAPGEERLLCYRAPLVIEGPSRMVGGGVLRVGKGLHHGNVTTRKKDETSTDVLGPCPKGPSTALGGEGTDVVGGGSVLFGSTTQVEGEEWQSFPEGMAFRVKDGFEIVARMHYLNASPAPLAIAPKYEWFTVDEAKVETEIGPFIWLIRDFEIPPRARHTELAECALPPGPMHVVTMMPHMHKLGVAFDAAWLGGPHDGQRFLASKGYDPDRGLIVQYEPSVDLGLGWGVRFSCTWENTFDKTIHEGVGDDEMCMLFGYAWPPENAYSLVGTSSGSCPTLVPP